MDTSAAVQVFVLIYILVVAALYFSSRYWLPLLTNLKGLLGFAVPLAGTPPAVPGPADIPPMAYSFRPGAPRPPRLKAPPLLEFSEPEGLHAYGHRLALCSRIVGYISAGNPTGFPLGLFREWHAARWQRSDDVQGVDSEQAIAADLQVVPVDDAAYDAIVAEFVSSASYAEMADLIHFCGEAFSAAKAGSAVHVAIVGLADKLAVVVPLGAHDHSQSDEDDRLFLERKLEVDFLPEIQFKVAHLRRMHGFFRLRLIALRDLPTAERRAERMADYRRHMEEHERMLGWLGSSA
jgi:hypothetical protein